MDELVRWLEEQIAEDELIARAASGSTVVGEPGNWQPAPGGDEWEATRTDCDEDELLVALRPGLPRPPEALSGYWGAIVDFKPEWEDPRVASPLPQFEHAARHDPARVLREVDAKRQLLALHEPSRNVGADSNEDDSSAFVVCCGLCQVGVVQDGDWPCETLRLLALPYSDRPGYREEWRP